MRKMNLLVNLPPGLQLLLPVLLNQTCFVVLGQKCYKETREDDTSAPPNCSLNFWNHQTSSIPHHHFTVAHQPAETGKLQVVSRRGLDCDVPAVPVIVHPVLLLLKLHKHNVAEVLAGSHIIGVDLCLNVKPTVKKKAETQRFCMEDHKSFKNLGFGLNNRKKTKVWVI